MKKIENKIIITDIYSWTDLISRLPFAAEDIYNITVDTYGYLHDVGTEIVLTRANGNPQGWETAKADFQKAIDRCKWAWKTAKMFAYH